MKNTLYLIVIFILHSLSVVYSQTDFRLGGISALNNDTTLTVNNIKFNLSFTLMLSIGTSSVINAQYMKSIHVLNSCFATKVSPPSFLDELKHIETGLFVLKINHTNDYIYDKEYKNKYYDIPIQMEYRFPVKIVNSWVSYGMCFNSVYPSPLLSTGLNVRLSKQLAFTIAPEMYLGSFTYFPFIPTHIKTYNIFAGFQFKM